MRGLRAPTVLDATTWQQAPDSPWPHHLLLSERLSSLAAGRIKGPAARQLCQAGRRTCEVRAARRRYGRSAVARPSCAALPTPIKFSADSSLSSPLCLMATAKNKDHI
ncbi:hypothetical protein SEVIR_3G145800v4 [Setaria viridis]|uniref:Uncharacterized protein n=2 Tax=Setaria TaxID=4554 RepID=A0A368QEX4_SETIT|nr:hypothetical protein SETIT_3G143600v2 [Setaria italica]RCV16500.1 hypothetical protein SETIT_3G143600v2 [Setaria italica]TKW25839.1 hypothetical protein SEVIR_3G145800v2 [Setaria viridis]